MVIIDQINDQYCMVVDGELRKVEKPKMKNIKHPQLTRVSRFDCRASGQRRIAGKSSDKKVS